MKRVILDTNIYGTIVLDKDRNLLKDTIIKSREVVVYGFSLIRKELRDTPRSIRIEGINLRNYLLNIYDEITKNRTLSNTREIEDVAKAYFIAYKELGGLKRKEIITDFMIIATGSVHELDIVVSQDNRTMLSDKAIKAYAIVNKIKSLRLPRLLNYEKFKKEIM